MQHFSRSHFKHHIINIKHKKGNDAQCSTVLPTTNPWRCIAKIFSPSWSLSWNGNVLHNCTALLHLPSIALLRRSLILHPSAPTPLRWRVSLSESTHLDLTRDGNSKEVSNTILAALLLCFSLSLSLSFLRVGSVLPLHRVCLVQCSVLLVMFPFALCYVYLPFSFLSFP